MNNTSTPLYMMEVPTLVWQFQSEILKQSGGNFTETLTAAFDRYYATYPRAEHDDPQFLKRNLMEVMLVNRKLQRELDHARLSNVALKNISHKNYKAVKSLKSKVQKSKSTKS